MYLDSEGIVFRQVRTAQGRKMILLFTKKYGKISCGSSIGERGKGKSSLSLRPFTYGNYHIFQGRTYYNLDRAEVIRNFYAIGEDLDKYTYASYALELTEKVVPEELPQPGIFQLLTEFLTELEKRKKSYVTLFLAYEVKLLRLLGLAPSIGIKEQESLILPKKFDIVNVLGFFEKQPLKSFEKIALEKEAAEAVMKIMKEYIAYHLDIGELKSETLLNNNF